MTNKEKLKELKKDKKKLNKAIKELKDAIVIKNNKNISNNISNNILSDIKNGDNYWYLNSTNIVCKAIFENSKDDIRRLQNNNFFISSDDALRYANIDKAYKEIIFEQNLKDPIDWANKNQNKSYLYYNYFIKQVYSSWSISRIQGVTYCSLFNRKLLNIMIKKIGKDNLEWYLQRC